MVENQVPVPQIGVLYNENYNGLLGKVLYLNDKMYKLLYVAGQQFIRTGSACYFNGDYTVVQANNVGFTCNAYAASNVDTMGLASTSGGYVLFLISGDNIIINKNGADTNYIANIFDGAQLVPYLNGMMRCANAWINTTAAILKSDTSTCVIQIYSATAANLITRVSVGDYVNCNTYGIYAPVSYIINDSTLAISLAMQGISNGFSVNAIVTYAAGSLGKASAYVTCANGIMYTINSIANTLNSWTSTEASSARIWCNAMAGSLFKVGDVYVAANQTSYSTLAITSINNVNAFTVNAAVTVSVANIIGISSNVQVYNYRAHVDCL